MQSLKVKKRNMKVMSDVLRKKGVLPAVFYGSKTESTPIEIVLKDFVGLWKEAGESTVFELEVDGKEKLSALIHDVDVHPVTMSPIHADFYIVEKGQKVTVEVPLVFEGVAPAVKDLGGMLVKVLHELEVEAEPANLPHEIIVDISTLVDFDSQITVADLKLPAGVEAQEDALEVVATVARPVEEEELEAPTELDLEGIEVEKRGKEEKAEVGKEEGKEKE